MIHIRQEVESDQRAVYKINAAAFETSAEAGLIDALRQQADPVVSLVAEVEGVVVGHILFSPVTLSGHPDLKLMGLAPMAVLPEHQRTGVGSELVRAGIEACVKCGATALVVLGHPAYYPKFGFVPSSRFGIDSDYEVPEEMFMAMELLPDSLKGKSGTIKYHDSFSGL